MSYNRPYNNNPLSTVLYVREGEDDAAAEAAKVAAAAAAKIALEAAVAEAVAKETAGLKAKNEELLGKVKTSAERLKLFGDLDPVKAKEMYLRLDHDEDMKLFSEGKKNEVIEKYTGRMRESHKEALQQAEERVKQEAARADTYKASVLDNQIRAAAGSLHKSAVEDALLLGRTVFSLDAKGVAVQLGSDGTPVLGKNGSTPFSPAEWIEMQKELKPHWFPVNTSGSGSGTVREANGNGKSIKRADFDNLTGPEQANLAKTGVKITD